MVNKQNSLLTAGEFAGLARTTKRTVLWYEEKGILKPKSVDPDNGYRLYEPNQIIDFQAILLLRKLNFSIAEIKGFLANHRSIETLFNLKRKALNEEISILTEALKDTEMYYDNLKKTGTLVNPKVETVRAFPILYIDRQGPYKNIGYYFDELGTCFTNIPRGTLGLTIYEDIGYQPRNAKVKVGFRKRRGLILKPEAKQSVKEMVVPGFKALSYSHRGTSKLLSMLWQEMKKYREKNGYRANTRLSFEDLELSRSEGETELLMPIL